MNKLFIEAKSIKTPEAHFLNAIIGAFFGDKEVEIVPMDGICNLFGEAIINQISIANETGDNVLVLVDADTASTGGGYMARNAYIAEQMSSRHIVFPYFIYPNNCDDGDVEILMESTARRDIHRTFFDCFEDYEKCVSGAKDKNTGRPLYNVPNRKGKLHTYINSQQLSNNQRRHLGTGDWLFDNIDFWDLNVDDLLPLKEFLKKNLK